MKEESNKLAEEDKARSAELKEKIEVCLELASVLPKKKPIKLGKKILVSVDDYNNALRIGAAASKLNENYIVSSNCLRLLQEELAAAEEKEREADEKLANEDRHIKDEAEKKAKEMKEEYKKGKDKENENKIKEFKKNYSKTYHYMKRYIEETTKEQVDVVLAKHFHWKWRDNSNGNSWNINVPQLDNGEHDREFGS